MLIKKLFLINILFLCIYSAIGQGFVLRPEIGIGTYAMSDLIGLQQQSISQSVINLKGTDKYPPYVFYGADLLLFVTPEIGFGVKYRFSSTGCSNEYADYSGFYREEILVGAKSMGGIVSYRNEWQNNLFFSLELSSGVEYSSIAIEDKLSLVDINESNTYDLNSHGWFLEPKIRLEKSFFSSIFIGAFVGYEYNHKSKIQSSGRNKLYVSYEDREATIDWSGMRVGISASLALKHRKYIK
jgi:hypothetical protein